MSGHPNRSSLDGLAGAESVRFYVTEHGFIVPAASILGKLTSEPLSGKIMALKLIQSVAILSMGLQLSYSGVVPAVVSGQQIPIEALPILSGHAEDQLRIAQLLGQVGTEGYLLRTPSILLSQIAKDDTSPSIALLAPEIRGRNNSNLPFSFNDGALWAGRGWNHLITIGAKARLGRITLILAPDLIYQENLPFQFIPFPPELVPERAIHANPFHPNPQSMDYPLRFGTKPLSEFDWGQTSITINAGAVAFGFSTENAWWGPGIKNGILMSNQAAGVPRAFLRTRKPLQTSLGAFEGRWILGYLQESDFFDLDPSNDVRTLNGISLTYQPWFDSGLTLGFARTVFARKFSGGIGGLAATFDAMHSVGTPNRGKSYLDRRARKLDQISALFGRWIFAPHGLEIFGEWARFEEPASFRDFLEFPQHSSGYTAGFQWVQPYERRARLRIQAEITNLEPSSTFRHLTPFSSYASRSVAHGYTQKGQVLGAGIGPGASSQWLALDRLTSRWNTGVFAGRIRWDSAAWLTSAVKRWGREDVSMFWGIRGGLEVSGWALSVDISHGVRINYLFQTFIPDILSGRAEGVDIANTSVSVNLAKSLWR